MFLSCRRALQLQVPTNDDDIDGNAAALPGAVDDIDHGHHPAGRNRGWQKTAGYDNRGGFLSEFSISKYFFFFNYNGALFCVLCRPIIMAMMIREKNIMKIIGLLVSVLGAQYGQLAAALSTLYRSIPPLLASPVSVRHCPNTNINFNATFQPSIINRQTLLNPQCTPACILTSLLPCPQDYYQYTK